MKKSTRIILVIAICLLCAGLVLTAVGYVCGASLRQIIHDDLWSWVVHDDDGIHLFSDRHKDDHHGSGKYDNEFDESNTYSIDADGVNKLSIDWIDGDIQLVAYDGDRIRLEESCKEEIDEDNSLRYKIKNGELYITCCREASYEIGILSNSLNGKNLNKPLVVKIPKTLADKLKELQIDAVSSNITADGLTIKEFYASTVSGDVSLSGSYADEVEVDTVSGDMDLALLQCPKDFSVDSTSGNITLRLPSGSSFLLEFETVSGKPEIKGFDADCLSDDDGFYEYQVGSGRYELDADTVSGDITIIKSGGN